MISYQWVNDHQKHGIFLFKTPFRLFRYDFRFTRYRRVKERIIFNRLLMLSLSLIRTSHSHLVSLTYPKSQTCDRRDSWKNIRRTFRKNRSLDGATIHNLHCFECCEHFRFLYLGNKLRYRDESKRDFNGVIYCKKCSKLHH